MKGSRFRVEGLGFKVWGLGLITEAGPRPINSDHNG